MEGLVRKLNIIRLGMNEYIELFEKAKLTILHIYIAGRATITPKKKLIIRKTFVY